MILLTERRAITGSSLLSFRRLNPPEGRVEFSSVGNVHVDKGCALEPHEIPQTLTSVGRWALNGDTNVPQCCWSPW